MMKNNYLIDFAYKLDSLISEINRLDAKIRLYRKNSNKFDFEFNVKFLMSPDYFEKLRNYIYSKAEENHGYDKQIVDLKRQIAKDYVSLVLRIQHEISRIDAFQEQEMNTIVYKKIYAAKYEYEMRQIEKYNVESSLIDKFLGINKYRKLMIKNHELKLKLVLKEYDKKSLEKKNIFELVNLLENTNIKNGDILCLQDDMIENFMIDRNTIKRNEDYSWKCVDMLPSGFFAKKEHYRILNNAIITENQRLEKELVDEDRLSELTGKQNVKLRRLNEKLAKILKLGLAMDQ